MDYNREDWWDKYKGLKKEATIKLGRCGDNIFLADTKGNILVRSISESDFLHLIKYLKKNGV